MTLPVTAVSRWMRNLTAIRATPLSGLVELEDLRDYGVRIISIGDGIDFPNDGNWLKIQFQFLINEMPVTDTSKKVRSVVKRRQ